MAETNHNKEREIMESDMRDLFAVGALAGGLGQEKVGNSDQAIGNNYMPTFLWMFSEQEIAQRAFKIADAMIIERSKQNGND